MKSTNAEPPIPALYEAELDAEQVRDLFTDLEHAAQIHEVRVKSGGTLRSTPTVPDLAALSVQLWSGSNQSLQIIYTHKQRTWIDTLMRTATGAKLVRMQYERFERP